MSMRSNVGVSPAFALAVRQPGVPATSAVEVVEVPVEELLERRRSRPAAPTVPPMLRAGRIAVAALTWAIAAIVVSLGGPWIAARAGASSAVVFKIATVLAMSGVLALPPLRARGLGPGEWMGVGWLCLAILTEIVVGLWVQPGWSELLGSTAKTAVPWMRDLLLLSWLAAPLTFSRRPA